MKNPFIVGIAGGSGAGKTLFLRTLQKHCDEEQLCIISQDNYYRPADKQEPDENGYLNFDRPDGIDDAGFLRDIDLLLNNKVVTRQEYMFNQPGLVGEQIELKPAPVIVVEGLFIFHFLEIRKILDIKVFIDSDHQTRLDRRLQRDHTERGLSMETILYQWENHVVPAYEKYLLPYREESDLILDNNGSIDDAVKQLVKIIHGQ